MHEACSGNDGDIDPVSKNFWHADTPGKVKVHVLRVCYDILPIASSLRTKRDYVNNGCFFCDVEDETIEHIGRDFRL